MKQTSLLDSFIKKAKNSQNKSLQQDSQINNTPFENQQIRKPIKINKKQNDQKLDNLIQSQSSDMQIIKQISNIQFEDLQKMELQKPRVQPQCKMTRLKKSSKKKMTYESQNQEQQQEQFNLKDQKQSQDELEQSFQKQQSDVEFKKRKNKKMPKGKPKTAQKNKQQQGQKEVVLYDKTNPFSRDQFTDKTPQWAIPGHPACMDANQIKKGESGYDQTTLYVPQGEWQKFSAPMKQYWRIKAQNFDKIILFKLGKFYQLFYQDALIANKYLDLKWMGTKMHNGFPEKSLQRYSNQFLKLGFKVVVVQQMETPQQMQERIKNDKKSQKTLNRQVTQILTKGTSVPVETENSYLPNYLISVYKYNSFIAYSLLDVSTNIILLGIVDNFQDFKTILYQTRPAQLLYDPDNLPFEYIDVMKQNWLNMIITKLINKKNLWHHLNSSNQIANLIQKGTLKKPEILNIIQNFDTIPKNLMMSTLSGLFCYLASLLKFQYVMSAVTFMFYQKEKADTNMILDSQALQHLQVFQTYLGQTGSLFSKVNKTQSKFGKRMFRRWMTSPLLGKYHINQRLDALEDLKEHRQERRDILNILSKLPDLQKMVNRLYHFAVTKTSASQAVYFSDLSTTRLKQFKDLFSHLQNSWGIFSILNGVKNDLKSIRLKRLITIASQQIKCEKQIYFQDEQNDLEQKGLLPNILSQLKQFDQLVLWKDGKPYPRPGLVNSYDSLVSQETEIIKQINAYLQQIRKMLKQPDIQFAHIKQRYQLEIPEKKKIKLPDYFSFTSKKKDYSRYITPKTQQFVEKLQKVQKQIKEQMGLFVSFFFQQFKKKQRTWQRYINILAEIDCLTGLSVYASHTMSCRPQFVDKGYQVKEAIHPSLNKVDFIPNDLSFQNQIIILTGPNMGGKSTILRTTCLLAILAQMGSYVPAKSYSASIIDRIFTRIGASDKLQQGKSTFFIQMEQTKSILSHATPNSLAIIDQLGRGTSTFDGMALAHAVLNHLITVSKCKCIFATHYHSLTNQFQKQNNVALKMMNYRIINEDDEKILFLYKLIKGKAQKSFGLNVAQIVGINRNVIEIAKLKSQEMHRAIQYKKTLVKVKEILNLIRFEKSKIVHS